jgi:hypothetical protein
MKQLLSLHRLICVAKQVGVISYWSSICLLNDRTLEDSGALS